MIISSKHYFNYFAYNLRLLHGSLDIRTAFDKPEVHGNFAFSLCAISVGYRLRHDGDGQLQVPKENSHLNITKKIRQLKLNIQLRTP